LSYEKGSVGPSKRRRVGKQSVEGEIIDGREETGKRQKKRRQGRSRDGKDPTVRYAKAVKQKNAVERDQRPALITRD